MTDADSFRNALIAEVLHRLYDESLPRILKCMDQLSNEQIWWRPNEESNSIGNLILHLSGNVNQWIYTGLGGFPDQRSRQQEFEARTDLDKTALQNLLVNSMEKIKPVIQDLPAFELLRQRVVQTFHETGLTILVHVTEHFSYHTGQIAYITKELTSQSLGFYDDIKLE